MRYAVVGLGYISQIAVLPAFANARSNSKLVALVSDDATKLETLSRRYKVPYTYDYDHYEDCLNSGHIDAVYIALPNSMHAEYSIRAARAGVHVLCEKPMAVTEEECLEMIDAASRNRVKLMIAYRLHFEAANLQAIKLVESGQLGEPRIFNSVFTMQVEAGNIRLDGDLGGGALYDIGIYCINAARYLFRSDPFEVFGWSVRGDDPRFKEVDEMTTAILRFPGDRLASLTCSFGASDRSVYEIVGTKGSLRVEPAYEYAEALAHEVTIGERTKVRSFSKRDQFGPELVYFSECIQTDREPEPSGLEGLIDVHIIRSLYRSSEKGSPMSLKWSRESRPEPRQQIDRPAIRKPELVHARKP